MAIREGMGLSQRAFARALGVAKTTVQQWESGLHSPTPRHVATLEKLLEVHRISTPPSRGGRPTSAFENRPDDQRPSQDRQQRARPQPAKKPLSPRVRAELERGHNRKTEQHRRRERRRTATIPPKVIDPLEHDRRHPVRPVAPEAPPPLDFSGLAASVKLTEQVLGLAPTPTPESAPSTKAGVGDVQSRRGRQHALRT
jgi:transcriptional regulator with XRE-family HTH domain